MSKVQREAKFKREFDKLLASYGAEAELVDVGDKCCGWHYAQAIQITFGSGMDNPDEFHEFFLAL